MKTTYRLLLISLISLILSNCNNSHRNESKYIETCRDSVGRTFLGEKIAKEELDKFIKDSTSNLSKGNVLLKDKEMLISIAEPILFEIYGKENIIKQRPYEIYPIENYWIMMGTLPSEMKGGTFTFVINKKTCEVIGISHGK